MPLSLSASSLTATRFVALNEGKDVGVDDGDGPMESSRHCCGVLLWQTIKRKQKPTTKMECFNASKSHGTDMIGIK